MLVGPLLELLPGVGGFLSAAWSEFSSRGRIKRIEDVFEKILAQLSPDFVLNAFADTPAGMQLLEQVVRRSELEHAETKREHFANLIVSSWIVDQPVDGIYDESVLFVEATAKFTDSHLAVLM
ncbi:MAG: hypothetical protein HYV60_25640 [Planctomycetia bacterium]|nr:hypothetical protein [Planctomycetia bacterium]